MNTNQFLNISKHKNILVSEILFLEADTNYTKIFFLNGKYFLAPKTLGLFEKQLDKYCFFRANRKSIFNVNHLIAIESDEFGRKYHSVRMINNIEIGVSRRRNIAFEELIKTKNLTI